MHAFEAWRCFWGLCILACTLLPRSRKDRADAHGHGRADHPPAAQQAHARVDGVICRWTRRSAAVRSSARAAASLTLCARSRFSRSSRAARAAPPQDEPDLGDSEDETPPGIRALDDETDSTRRATSRTSGRSRPRTAGCAEPCSTRLRRPPGARRRRRAARAVDAGRRGPARFRRPAVRGRGRDVVAVQVVGLWPADDARLRDRVGPRRRPGRAARARRRGRPPRAPLPVGPARVLRVVRVGARSFSSRGYRAERGRAGPRARAPPRAPLSKVPHRHAHRHRRPQGREAARRPARGTARTGGTRS